MNHDLKNPTRAQSLAGGLIFFILLMTAFSKPAAAELKTALQHIPQAQLVGEARLRYLVWNVFDAKLYAPSGRWQPGAPYALTLRYLREISGKTIVDQSVDEIRKQGFANNAMLSKWRGKMETLFTDVSEGTTITGIRDENGGAVFFRDGKKLGEIKDREFSSRFFEIWLGDKASDQKFRRKLVGKSF